METRTDSRALALSRAFSSSGLTEVDSQNGPINRISQLKRLLGDSRVSDSDKAQFQAELSEASRLLDRSEQFVPRP